MNILRIPNKDSFIIQIDSAEELIHYEQSALDLFATIRYDENSDRIILNKENLTEKFFDLKTGIAGGILQKIINYQFKIAIVGDFSNYSSKSYNDFIYETNKGRSIFFLNSKNEAIEKLSSI